MLSITQISQEFNEKKVPTSYMDWPPIDYFGLDFRPHIQAVFIVLRNEGKLLALKNYKKESPIFGEDSGESSLSCPGVCEAINKNLDFLNSIGLNSGGGFSFAVRIVQLYTRKGLKGVWEQHFDDNKRASEAAKKPIDSLTKHQHRFFSSEKTIEKTKTKVEILPTTQLDNLSDSGFSLPCVIL